MTTNATLPSASESKVAARARWRPLTVIGSGEGLRAERLNAALRSRGLPLPRYVGYQEIGTSRFSPEPRAIVRFESPGESVDALEAIVKVGSDMARVEGAPVPESDADYEALGACTIGYPRAWYLGFLDLLSRVERACDDREDVLRTTSKDELAILFDKSRCHRRLEDAGVAVPRSFGSAATGYELTERLRRIGAPRVFVKSRHGSAAAGVVALTLGSPHAPDRWLAYTTSTLASVKGRVRVVNSLRLKKYEGRRAVEELLGAFVAHGVHIEEWIPKLAVDGRVSDVRIVTFGGQPRHAIVRCARGPITNLHLGNERCVVSSLQDRIGRASWEDALSTCRSVAKLFPASLLLGIDIAFHARRKTHAVLEVNAFGDFVQGVRDRGEDPAEAWVSTVARGWSSGARELR